MTSTPSSSYVPGGPQVLLLRKALRRFPSGVTVVTVGDGARARAMTAGGLFHGMTASSFAAVSLDPPLLAVSVNKPDLMHRLLALTDDGGDRAGLGPLCGTNPTTTPWDPG